MSDVSEAVGMLRSDPDAFDALRDATAERLGVDPGVVEDYWATEVLRAVASPLEGVDQVVFKGGTSLSKAYRIIERFSEDIDLLVVTGLTGNPLKRLLRMIADLVSAHLDIEHAREYEGRGFLNARYRYPVRREVPFLTAGVLLKIGSRADQPRTSTWRSDPSCPTLPTRSTPRRATTTPTWLPSRSPCSPPNARWPRSWPFCTTAPLSAILTPTPGARHLYDVAMLLGNDRVRDALCDGQIVELMIDIDARSHAAGWDFTPRPGTGFAASPAFTDDSTIAAALPRRLHHARRSRLGPPAQLRRSHRHHQVQPPPPLSRGCFDRPTRPCRRARLRPTRGRRRSRRSCRMPWVGASRAPWLQPE